MPEKGAAHPITKADLEQHLSKVDEHMELINRGSGNFESLFTLVKDIGGDKHVLAREVQDTLGILRQGFSLYYEMHHLLEERVNQVQSTPEERGLFKNAYAMFAAGSFISHQIDLLLGDQEAHPLPTRKEGYFRFELGKDDTLNNTLSKYYGLISLGKMKKAIKEGADLPKASLEFFKFLRDEAITKKSLLHQDLVKLVEEVEFRILEEYSLKGFESSYEEKAISQATFVPIATHEVAGNVLAKKEMLRDMDRIALFSVQEKRNPILEVGGLSWSVLYDGLPGTGKSSLFRMGLTRLNQRCEQVSEFMQRKNFGKLFWKQIIIDQSVKDEYYGKTGKNLLAALNETKKTDRIYIITTDDIDLLVSGDRNAASGGADKDILNILMQYADGINTIIRGNVQWWAATNDATSMDPALRQRFIARYAVDGPEAWYDFADILHSKLSTWITSGIVKVDPGTGYAPYQMRKGETGDEEEIVKEKVLSSKITLRDIGEVAAEMKRKNPRFTGRAVHAAAEAIKKRINNYDVPEEWYNNPEVFFWKPYKERVNMLKELCAPITGEVIIQEFERYFTSEQRYASEKFESDVTKSVHGYQVQRETARRVQEEKK